MVNALLTMIFMVNTSPGSGVLRYEPGDCYEEASGKMGFLGLADGRRLRQRWLQRLTDDPGARPWTFALTKVALDHSSATFFMSGTRQIAILKTRLRGSFAAERRQNLVLASRLSGDRDRFRVDQSLVDDLATLGQAHGLHNIVVVGEYQRASVLVPEGAEEIIEVARE